MENMKYLKFRNFGNEQKAVTGIVVALLLIGLFFSIIAFIQTVYVPQWMTQKEAENMDSISDQFSNLKSSIDLLTVSGQNNKPISIPIKMGTKELPFLISQRSHGNLEILPNEHSMEINYMCADTGTPQFVKYNLGSLKYSSLNNYHIQKSYIYENGAVILEQSSGETMIMSPSLYGSDEKLVFDLIGLCGMDNKTSITGFGTYPVKTEFSHSDFSNWTHVFEIKVETSKPQIWKTYFDYVMNETNLDYANGDYIINVDTLNNEVIIGISGGFPLELTINYIKTKITPGWS